jgi:hypothetical protein
MKKLTDLTDTEINYWMCVKDGYEKAWIVKTNPQDPGICYAAYKGKEIRSLYLGNGDPKLSTMLEGYRASLRFGKPGGIRKKPARWLAVLPEYPDRETVGDSPAHALCLALLWEEYGEEIEEVPAENIIQKY